jgi:hypothetical protein
MDWPKNTSFHDSTLKTVSSTPATIKMEFEDVVVDDCKKSAEMVFEGVHDLTEDGSPSPQLAMEMPDAEILTLKEKDGWVHLIVVWRDYEKRLSSTKAYRFGSRATRFRVLPPTPVNI